VVKDQLEDILDVWCGFVASHPHLAVYFSKTDGGGLDPSYLARVRARFAWTKVVLLTAILWTQPYVAEKGF
jgi:hypothetical protein